MRTADPTPDAPVRPRRWSAASGGAMGYQPSLDGLRAVSVVAVMLYHGGFTWMHGGFYGVEVFFVVSGFLITSLLLEEHASTGTTSLRQFWLRRARRLLPALGAMFVAVGVWAAAFGSAEQQSELRRDFPWSIFYLGNWGQVLGKVAYYSPADPPLLRHLWSLAVEEQWYIVWPLVFVALAATRWRSTTTAGVLLGVFVGIWAWMWWLTRSGLDVPVSLLGKDVDRTNFLYLSTFTRAGGLVLGAAAAFVWRPWRGARTDVEQRPLLALQAIGGAAAAALLVAFCTADLAVGYTFQWLLPVVSVLSCVVVCIVVHPGAPELRAIFGHPWLVAIGRRSYGLYLWHWPVLVALDARGGSAVRFAGAMAIAVALSEACYRYVETPVRHGWIRVHLAAWRARDESGRAQVPQRAAAFSVGGATLVLALVGFYAQVKPFDRAAGGDDAQFSLPTTPAPAPTTPEGAASTVPATAAAPTTVPGPLRLVLVGDSQAHALAVNRPDGIDDTFDITNGSVEGCGVFEKGRALTTRAGFDRTFGICDGWEQKWADAAAGSDAQVALVVLGAWDVFDIALPAGVVQFGSPPFDATFLSQLQLGIDALAATGARVALLEVPCMRPVNADGATVPALPERGYDDRVAHVNRLLQQAAAANSATTTFVAGPPQWCDDETISTDVGYRWDGVHVYKPGANLVYETIAPALLALRPTG